MNQLDWIVLITTLLLVLVYGVYKSKTTKNLEGYFLSNRSMPWWIILLSIMGTQASAVTFLAAPGQAYTDGMRFVQYYFGLPIAAIIICISFVPAFSRKKIFTAYEYLGSRFDNKTRSFTSFLFLLQRGLSTGISVFAPSIILSTILNWDIYWTIFFMGGLLILYTVLGGAKAVAYTQKLQFGIICLGMVLAGYYIVHNLPQEIGFASALEVGGKLGKMNIITTGFEETGKFNWGDRYNIISGVIGGCFLALSYFGTDQSQVGRYLTARSIKESRMGLLMNGMVKVPMQFLILLVGVLVFTFYQFHKAPAFFNEREIQRLEKSEYAPQLQTLQLRMSAVNDQREQVMQTYINDRSDEQIIRLKELQIITDSVRAEVKGLVKLNAGNENDTNYIFLRFVMDYLPVGLVGLLIAVIFLASWGSIAAALNSLASSTMIDFHKRYSRREHTPLQEYRLSKFYTFLWGVFCMVVAVFVSNIGNSLIEAVNILGSLFYGTILGIFLVAFYCKKVNGTAVFIAAIITELLVIGCFILDSSGVFPIGFLWLNVIGAVLLPLIALLIQTFLKEQHGIAEEV